MALVTRTLVAPFAGSGEVAVALTFLMFGTFTSLVFMMARRLYTGWSIAGVGATGVLVEWIAARLDFPHTIALTIWRDPAVLWLAGWTGTWGIVVPYLGNKRCYSLFPCHLTHSAQCNCGAGDPCAGSRNGLASAVEVQTE
jgi:hypothetical protein